MGNENYPQSWLSRSSYQEIKDELFEKHGLVDEKVNEKAIYALYLAIEFSTREWEVEDFFQRMIPLLTNLEDEAEGLE